MDPIHLIAKLFAMMFASCGVGMMVFGVASLNVRMVKTSIIPLSFFFVIAEMFFR